MFQNVRGILEELQILLAPDKEHKKTFPKVPILGFRNGKTLKGYLVRGALPKMDNTEGSEACGNGTCQVCNQVISTKILLITINNFTTKAYGEVFKIQSGNSENVIYLLRPKICDDAPYVGKAQTKFRLRLNNYKSKLRSFRKGK